VPQRVLVVTSENDADGSYRTALAPYCDVEVVSSGAGALELMLVDRSIKLVLCAAQASDVTACEFLQNLSWVVPGNRPPVVVFGEICPNESLRALELGAIQCLPEACGPKTLAREVDLLLRSDVLACAGQRVRPAAGARRRARMGRP
jgi:DNA-binding response OmpR family regulator